MLSLLLAASASAPLPPLAWDWDRPQRLYAETEVRLPELMWFEAEFNKNARVVGYQIRAVLDCDGTDRESRRKRHVRCAIQDIGLVAGAHPGDEGRLQAILDEYDQVLTQATLALVVRTDGRVIDVNLDEVPAQNLRTRARKERMRLLMRSLVAGLEVPLPTDRDRQAAGDEGALWVSNQALLCTLPSFYGTAGPAEAVHRATLDGQQVQIATTGRGIISAGHNTNTYTCNFQARTTWDPAAGGVDQREWTMHGEPTAGSPIAMGAAGYPYQQHGAIRRLDAGQPADVGPTEEIPLRVDAPTAVQPTGQPAGPAGGRPVP